MSKRYWSIRNSFGNECGVVGFGSSNPIRDWMSASNVDSDVGFSSVLVVDGKDYERPKTPELGKMSSVQGESQTIGSFLDWLRSERELEICELEPYREGMNRQDYDPVRTSIEGLLAEYFEIDLDIVDREKREILAWMRICDGGDPVEEFAELGLD